MSASDKLDLTQFDGHTEGEWYKWRGCIYAGRPKVKTRSALLGYTAEVCEMPDPDEWDRGSRELKANATLIAASPVLLAKLREAVELLRTANAFIIPKRNGEESEMQHRVNAFLATIHTGEEPAP